MICPFDGMAADLGSMTRIPLLLYTKLRKNETILEINQWHWGQAAVIRY
jgi:hypothetical protein